MNARTLNVRETLKLPIENLNMSVKATYALQRAGLRTVVDLVQASENWLLHNAVPRTVINEVQQRLSELSLHLDMEPGVVAGILTGGLDTPRPGAKPVLVEAPKPAVSEVSEPQRAFLCRVRDAHEDVYLTALSGHERRTAHRLFDAGLVAIDDTRGGITITPEGRKIADAGPVPIRAKERRRLKLSGAKPKSAVADPVVGEKVEKPAAVDAKVEKPESAEERPSMTVKFAVAPEPSNVKAFPQALAFLHPKNREKAEALAEAYGISVESVINVALSDLFDAKLSALRDATDE